LRAVDSCDITQTAPGAPMFKSIRALPDLKKLCVKFYSFVVFLLHEEDVRELLETCLRRFVA